MSEKKKLTLTISEDVIRRAKELARQWDTSVSGLVEEGLRGLTESRQPDTPLVGELRGSLPPGADREEYRRHLREKHGE